VLRFGRDSRSAEPWLSPPRLGTLAEEEAEGERHARREHTLRRRYLRRYVSLHRLLREAASIMTAANGLEQ
jgi:hypothetical protein